MANLSVPFTIHIKVYFKDQKNKYQKACNINYKNINSKHEIYSVMSRMVAVF